MKRSALSLLLAVVVAGAGTFLVLDHQRLDSPTIDEPFHALASAEVAIAGTYYANLEHPPLAKLLAGVCLRAAGARPPRFSQPFEMKSAEQPGPFCYHNAIPPETLFKAARRPFPILFFILVLTSFLAGRRIGGNVAGLLGAAFVAFEPGSVAHAGLLHTDVLAELGFLATLFAAHVAFERRSFAHWALVGLLLGLSLSGKFSCVLLVPVLVLLALVSILIDRRRGEGAERRLFGGLLIAFGVGAATLLGVYAIAMRNMDRAGARTAVRIHLLASVREARPATVERLVALSRVCPPLAHYLAGLVGISRQNELGGNVNVLHGRLSQEGFWDYFFVAFGVKSALGLLLAAALGVALLLRNVRRLDFTLALLFLPVVYLFVSTMGASYNIGIRHVLPVYPLLALTAIAAVARFLPRRAGWSALGLCAALQLVETASVHPHEISFFNILVGGPSHGAEWLNDSNLDWGQDLDRLAIELRRRGEARGATIAYFGGGLSTRECPEARTFDPLTTPLTPGLYAVSSFILAAVPELLVLHGDPARAAGYARLRIAALTRGERVGRVGYSILLFRLREGTSPRSPSE